MGELQGALEEAEATLEMEENRVLRSQLELANVRQEIDRRVAEKEEEFNNTRKNHARAMESLELPLRPSREPRVRVSASRSSLRERSMNLRLVSTTPTRPTL